MGQSRKDLGSLWSCWAAVGTSWVLLKPRQLSRSLSAPSLSGSRTKPPSPEAPALVPARGGEGSQYWGRS